MNAPDPNNPVQPAEGAPHNLNTRLRQQHLAELRLFSLNSSWLSTLWALLHPSTWRERFYQASRCNLFIALVHWWFSFVASLFFTLLFSPATIFTDPISLVSTVVLYSVVGIVLTFWAIVLTSWRAVGGAAITKAISNKWANGTSLENWPNPAILGDEATRTLNSARAFLSGIIPTTIEQKADLDDENPDFISLNKTTRVFSVVLARALLILSSVVYERRDEEVAAAASIAVEAKYMHDAGVIGDETYANERRRADETLFASEEPIRRRAQEWGLSFEGLSDHQVVSGSFASLFFTPPTSTELPFIVLVFKGTGVTNYSEFVTDMSFSRVPASAFFGPGSGSAHKVFPTEENTLTGDAYGSIVSAVKHVARRINEERQSTVKIPLWVTGHSLGASLAALAFARFFKEPRDLGENVELRDAMLFHTLRVGDASWASTVENLLLTPRNRENVLWHVSTRFDIAPHFPVGVSDKPILRGVLSPGSVLDFAHAGPQIKLRPLFSLPGTAYRVDRIGSLHGATEVRVVTDSFGQSVAQPDEGKRAWWGTSAKLASIYQQPRNPLYWLMFLVPVPFYDHAPWSTYHALTNIGTHSFDNENEQEAARARLTAAAPLAIAAAVTLDPTEPAFEAALAIEPVGGIEEVNNGFEVLEGGEGGRQAAASWHAPSSSTEDVPAAICVDWPEKNGNVAPITVDVEVKPEEEEDAKDESTFLPTPPNSAQPTKKTARFADAVYAEGEKENGSGEGGTFLTVEQDEANKGGAEGVTVV
ncbi:hypothetical protein JCM8547_002163 [Rhodosporidiobolus lusitaniae]